MNKVVQKQFQQLSSGCVEVFPEDEFKKKLEFSILNEKPLRVKLGIDPTGPDIHIGHMVPFRKLRQFQDLGHQAVLIIGDYTAQIGDPTGRESERPKLSADQVKQNSEQYLEQVYKVLDKNKTQVCYQSEWFNDYSLLSLLQDSAFISLAKLLSHDTFSQRLENGVHLGLHEVLYPVLQGLDSVFVQADIELGGSDQKFNILVGRDYQKAKNLAPQCALLLPILLGTDGKQKMSKSLGNAIPVLASPEDQFGKVMSIPDDLLTNYALYATDFSFEDSEKFIKLLESGELHPNEAKKRLASSVVSLYHSVQAGEEARRQFEQVFARKKLPDTIPEITATQSLSLIDLLEQSGLFSSRGEIRRLIKQNAVGIYEGEKLQDEALQIDPLIFHGKILKIGKRHFLRIKSDG